MTKYLLCICLSVGLAASTARAADLTGVWEGKQTCAAFDGAKSRVKIEPSVLWVSQAGGSLNVEVEGLFPYNGHVIDDASKPNRGEAVLIACGSTEDGGEVGRFKVRTRPDNGKGRIKGSSIFGTSATFLTCTWSYKRTSTLDPGVGTCP